MKMLIRNIVRKLLGTKEFETISDSLERKKYKFIARVNNQHFNKSDLKITLEKLGLRKGDIVIVHSAWRAFVGYEGSPNEIIEVILEIIGKEGTILMPAFTNNKDIFHYYDKTSAGVISEVFRTTYGVYRSLDSNFSMIAIGKEANKLTRDHVKSKYYFDYNSPYYKAMKAKAKILLLGLGKKPHKISLFHCVTYELRNVVSHYKNVYSLNRGIILFDKDGKEIHKEIIDRNPKFQNDKRKFRKLFKCNIHKENYNRLNKTDMFLFESDTMFENAKKYIIENNFNLYK